MSGRTSEQHVSFLFAELFLFFLKEKEKAYLSASRQMRASQPSAGATRRRKERKEEFDVMEALSSPDAAERVREVADTRFCLESVWKTTAPERAAGGLQWFSITLWSLSEPFSERFLTAELTEGFITLRNAANRKVRVD